MLAPPSADPIAPAPLRSSGNSHWAVTSVVCVLVAVVATGLLINVVTGLAVDDSLSAFVMAVNQVDSSALTEVLAGEGEQWINRSEWLAATGSTVSLTGCESAGGLVTCEVNYGHGWFYNQAAPPEIERHGALMTSISVEVGEESVRVVDWPMPTELDAVEESFRRWAMRAHPSRADLMWDTTQNGAPLRVDSISGETHMSLLEEYLRYLNRRSESG